MLWTSLLVVAALGTASCLGPNSDTPVREVPAARGIILISLDTLRADHLGVYGHDRDTSPEFDALARRGALFLNAIAPSHGTLPSHMTLFTGLHPLEHGVFLPDAVLSPEIPTVPEILKERGFRTAGFTEGGFVSGRYGFRRGFDHFSDEAAGEPDDIETTFTRGLDFLEGVDEAERFFLFLHTYAPHDPYNPPEPHRSLYWTGEPPVGAFAPTGPNFLRFNDGGLPLVERAVDWYEALYDGGIHYTDSVLGDLVADIDRMGLLDEIALVITSDHGEEFTEHGRLAHTQLYDENLRIPLLVVHPGGQPGHRIESLVGLVDLPATLFELVGVEGPPGRSSEEEGDGNRSGWQSWTSGRSLVDLIAGDSGPTQSWALAESWGDLDRTLYWRDEDELFQLIRFEPWFDGEGYWASRELIFDWTGPRLAFEAMSFHEPRDIRVEVDGEATTDFTLEPAWKPVELELPEAVRTACPGSGIRRIRLHTSDCVSPSSVGGGEDPRCLSFKVRGISVERIELYDLVADPRGANDISRVRVDVRRFLVERLDEFLYERLASPDTSDLSPDLELRLRALGYLR